MSIKFFSIAMMISRVVIFISAVVLTSAQTNNYSFPQILSKCKYGEKSFDTCIRDVLNDLRRFFKTGIPEYNIRPFDPHRAASVLQRRGRDGLFSYQLVLRNVSEYGWTDSHVTNYITDAPRNRIIYSQYFPEKNLDGFYEFTGSVAGNLINRRGIWNLTLSDYSQTTIVKRLGAGGPGSNLKVNVAVDRIGGMSLHISDFFGNNRQVLNGIADSLINNMWQLGLPVVTPLINDLVSTAFTDIFNDSFRNFPIGNFVQ